MQTVSRGSSRRNIQQETQTALEIRKENREIRNNIVDNRLSSDCNTKAVSLTVLSRFSLGSYEGR